MIVLLTAVIFPPLVPFCLGRFWLAVLCTVLMATFIGWPVAAAIALIDYVIEGSKPLG